MAKLLVLKMLMELLTAPWLFATQLMQSNAA